MTDRDPLATGLGELGEFEPPALLAPAVTSRSRPFAAVAGLRPRASWALPAAAATVGGSPESTTLVALLRPAVGPVLGFAASAACASMMLFRTLSLRFLPPFVALAPAAPDAVPPPRERNLGCSVRRNTPDESRSAMEMITTGVEGERNDEAGVDERAWTACAGAGAAVDIQVEWGGGRVWPARRSSSPARTNEQSGRGEMGWSLAPSPAVLFHASSVPASPVRGLPGERGGGFVCPQDRESGEYEARVGRRDGPRTARAGAIRSGLRATPDSLLRRSLATSSVQAWRLKGYSLKPSDLCLSRRSVRPSSTGFQDEPAQRLFCIHLAPHALARLVHPTLLCRAHPPAQRI